MIKSENSIPRSAHQSKRSVSAAVTKVDILLINSLFMWLKFKHCERLKPTYPAKAEIHKSQDYATNFK